MNHATNPGRVTILQGDVRAVLANLRPNSFDCVISSPPYYGLRAYGTDPQVWGGDDPACEHQFGDDKIRKLRGPRGPKSTLDHVSHPGCLDHPNNGAFCRHCGAWRGELGLEPHLGMHLDHMVGIFRLVRRVLKPGGTLWLNYGDCYATSPNGRSAADTKANGRDDRTFRDKPFSTVGPIYVDGDKRAAAGLFKPKDLCMVPNRLAIALQDDGWWVRSEIVWGKCLSGGAWLYAKTATAIGPMMLKDLVRLKPETVQLWTGERWTRVIAWTKREGRANAKELVLRSGERIGCTDEHVWPTSRGLVRTDNLRVGDALQTTGLPTSDQRSGWLTEDAFWFAGLYLAEGSRSGETIQIAGHVKEAQRADRVRQLVDHYGGSARVYSRGNCQHIHIDSLALSAVLKSLIAGHTAKDKHLSPNAWAYRNWALKKIAEGYLEGDGEKDGARVRLGFCRNYGLERDLRCLAARLGASISLRPKTSRNQTGTFPSFKGEWRWTRSGHHNECDRGSIIEIRNSRGRKFWDVTVEDWPHLFALASGVLTHNSNPMPDSSGRYRPSTAHEKIFMLTKSADHYYDAAAVAMACSANTHARISKYSAPTGWDQSIGNGGHGVIHRAGRGAGPKSRPDQYEGIKSNRNFHEATAGAVSTRHLRNYEGAPLMVWPMATHSFKDAHFATFPPELVERCLAAGCPEFTCSECGMALDNSIKETIRSSTNGNDLRSLRDDVPQTTVPKRKNPLLQPKMRSNRENIDASERSLQMVQEPDPPRSARSNKKILQQNMRLSVDGKAPKNDQRSLHHDEGVRADLQAGSPERLKGRIRDGASLGDGSAAQSVFTSDRNRSPQKWRESEERRRKSRTDDKDQARQVTKGAHRKNTLSSLRRTNSLIPTCPCCGANLARVGAIVPGTVLDPFGGSGTVGMVAAARGLDATLVELKPEYCDMAAARIAAAFGPKVLRDDKTHR